jgi:tetratricopeptide (TPR) repeat protein
MTDNHILLYRLAKLMLEKEQHFLPVDFLFDDDEIGEFVRSIQIDSPYQQMLFEGVLTESVRNEALFVSFTVEGYFHFVLGEVIYNETKGQDVGMLTQIIIENNLTGANEGVEQCLIREITGQQFQRLFQLIDSTKVASQYCVVPLAYAILKASEEIKDNSITHVQDLINSLLENQTRNDFNVLLNAIVFLEQSQKNGCLLTLFELLNRVDQFSNIDFLKILIKGLSYLQQEYKIDILKKIEFELIKFETNEDFPDVIFEIGTKYIMSGNYKKAIALIEKAKSIYEFRSGNFNVQLEKSFSNLGAAYWYMGNIEMTKYYFEMSLEACYRIFGVQHVNTAGSLQNLALVNILKEEYAESISIFNKSLEISLKMEGQNHPNVARLLSNLGSAHFKLGNIELASEYFQKALIIDSKVLHHSHPSLALDYDDIGDVFLSTGDKLNALENFEKSKAIFINNFGIDYPHVKMLEEKIKNLAF